MSVRVTLILLALIVIVNVANVVGVSVRLICKVTAFNVKLFLILKMVVTTSLNFMIIFAFRTELLELKINSLSINDALVKSYSYCCSWPPSIRIMSKDFDMSTAYPTVLHGAVPDPQFG